MTLGENLQTTNGLTSLATVDKKLSIPNATPTEVVVDGDAGEEPAKAAMEVMAAAADAVADGDSIIEAAEVVTQ